MYECSTFCQHLLLLVVSTRILANHYADLIIFFKKIYFFQKSGLSKNMVQFLAEEAKRPFFFKKSGLSKNMGFSSLLKKLTDQKKNRTFHYCSAFKCPPKKTLKLKTLFLKADINYTNLKIGNKLEKRFSVMQSNDKSTLVVNKSDMTKSM